jgi:transcriptional regulator of acetoin/glycerol metabolism
MAHSLHMQRMTSVCGKKSLNQPSCGEKNVQKDITEVLGQLMQGEVASLRDTRSAMVRWALQRSHGNVSHAAQLLGVSRGTIYRYARPVSAYLAKTAT